MIKDVREDRIRRIARALYREAIENDCKTDAIENWVKAENIYKNKLKYFWWRLWHLAEGRNSAAAIATICTAISLLLTLLVIYKTLPSERPIIDLIHDEAKGSFNDQTKFLNIDLLLLFKNAGKHPAKEIEIAIAGGVKGNKKSFVKITKQKIANEIGMKCIFNWNQRMSVPIAINKDGELGYKPFNTIILIRVKYKDSFDLLRFKPYSTYFWIIYNTGSAAASHATVEDVEADKEELLKCIQ